MALLRMMWLPILEGSLLKFAVPIPPARQTVRLSLSSLFWMIQWNPRLVITIPSWGTARGGAQLVAAWRMWKPSRVMYFKFTTVGAKTYLRTLISAISLLGFLLPKLPQMVVLVASIEVRQVLAWRLTSVSVSFSG